MALQHRTIGIALTVLLIIGYGIGHNRMDRLRSERPAETKRAQALSLEPAVLKVVSGPFRGLMADYLILKASIFMGGVWQPTDEDWGAVYTLLKQSLYLDPLFFQTGYYIQGLLSWRKGMHSKAVDLLKYHAEHRYWDWEPMFYLGFDYFMYLKDNTMAAEYMQKSALRPGAIVITKTLAARLAQRSGQTLTAIAFLKTILEQAQDEPTKEIYAKRLKAYLGIHEIEKAIEVFEKQHGHKPDSLEALVAGGFLPNLPENPFMDHFIYEPDTGMVFFDTVR